MNTVSDGKTINIFVVEDMQQLVALHQRWIDMVGWRCSCSLTGKEALKLFNSNSDFDIVILDMVLPDISGAEVFEKIRKIRPDIPVIICSGYSEEMNRMTEEEQVAIVSKPFDIGELRSEVLRLVAGS